jgi:hypothetical protein
VEAAVNFTMMIGVEPLGTRHLNSIRSLAEKSLDPHLVVSEPITKPTQALKLFGMDAQSDQTPSPLVYFIGHAYARKESRLHIQSGLEMFCKQQRERPDPRYENSFDIFCGDEFGGKTSFFELSYGRVQVEDELDDDRIRLARTRPLFFFNACQSAQYPPSPSAGLAYRLLNNNAGGFIGSEVFIDAKFAEDFGELFWREFLCGASVGEAMLNVRRKLTDQKILLGLAYTHYGPIGTRLQRGLLLPEEPGRLADG